MIWRALAVVGALGVPLAAALVGEASPSPWLLPGIAAGLLLVLVIARPRGWFSFLVAAGLAFLAARAAPLGREALAPADTNSATIPTIDLTKGEALPPSGELVAIRGFLRDDYHLDEYRVKPGDRPDQKESAPRVLVPFLGSREQAITPDQPILVARIPGDLERPGHAIVLRGRLGPLDPSLFEALFATTAELREADSVQLETYLLDTTDVPAPSRPWVQLLLCVGAAGVALALALGSLAEPDDAEPAAGS